MNLVRILNSRTFRTRGLTLVEVMIASALGSMVLACVGSLSIYGTRSSIALMNYTDLDAKSRYAADVISREMRNATAVTSLQTNGTIRSIEVLTLDAGRVTLTWDANSRTLVLTRVGQAPFTALTECDRWDCGLFQRTPIVTSTNLLFFPATNSTGTLDLSLCKLVNMSWKCSRTIMGSKVNTESVQAAQLVLRNKQ